MGANDNTAKSTGEPLQASRLANNMELAKKAAKHIIEYAQQGYYGKVIFNFKGGEIYQVDLERTEKVDKIGK